MVMVDRSGSKLSDCKLLHLYDLRHANHPSSLFIIGWNAFWTSAICLFIKYVLRIPLRYSEEQLLIGDGEVHGELPYAFFHDGRHEYDARYGHAEEGILQGHEPEIVKSGSSEGSGDKIEKQA
jgi:hypothetical protein